MINAGEGTIFHEPEPRVESGGWRVGVEPVGRIVSVENHDAAGDVWRDAGAIQRTLIHIDAHHDMWWIADPRHVTIANFISRALAEDIVREVFWVVPDGTWEDARGRRSVSRHLRRLTSGYPAPSGDVRIEKSGATAVVLGKRLTVCSLGSLPPIDEAVLLDIDVDFLVIPRVSFAETDDYTTLPWCWPEELVARLRAAAVTTDLVTIAASVEGGYTPLTWKHLADELRERLARAGGGTPEARGFDLMREAALASERGDRSAAEKKYREAATMLPASAAPLLHLAHLAADAGRSRSAQDLYQRALALDSSYRTPFSSAGFPLYWTGRHRAAEKEFRRVLMLDPHDPYGQLGLALVAIEETRWEEAAVWVAAALAVDGDLVEAHRAHGSVLAHQGRRREAIAAFELSLQLILSGHKAIANEALTNIPAGRLVDAGHCAVHARLADLHAAQGQTDRAISGYTISLAGGHDGVGLRARLAWLHFCQRDWRSALAQMLQLARVSPRLLRSAVTRRF